MMAGYESQVFGASDECDLLIGGCDSSKHNYSEDHTSGDKSTALNDDCCSLDDEELLTHAHRATPLRFLWSRVRNIVPYAVVGDGSRRDVVDDDDFAPNWTLNNGGNIYKPNHGGKVYRPSKRTLKQPLNNSKQSKKASHGRKPTYVDVGDADSSGRNKNLGFKLAKNHDSSQRRLPNHHNSHPTYLRNKFSCRLLFYFLLGLLLLVGVVLILLRVFGVLQTSTNKQLYLRPKDDRESIAQNVARIEADRWVVLKDRCRIPNLDPQHESILDYIETKPAFNCTRILIKNKAVGQPAAALTYVSANRLYFTGQAIKMNALKRCCYKQITRSDENDNDLVYSDSCSPINENGFRPSRASLIQVQCSSLNYTNVHPFVFRDPDDEAASRRVAAKKLDTKQYYNVVIVGVDTISRLNGLRQLNKSINLLRRKFKALEFLGYNKVGENTFPNLVPFLTGLRPEQLTEVQCWLTKNYSSESESGDDFLDDCKYLWNFYQDFGYRTYFGEDWPAASTFNYLKQGFRSQPTNYYARPYTIARDKLLVPPVKMGCTSPCLWDKSVAELDLMNLKSFIEQHKDVPHFAFHWINCPQHDDLNGASRIDGLLEKFFNDIHGMSQADRTFVIFFSDHGYRWNNFVSTRIGHYEASLPMLTIAPPKRFIENHPDLYENLKGHLKTLITPFDMFKTLVEIRNLGLKPTNRLHKLEGSRRAQAPFAWLSGHSETTTKPTSTPSTAVDELGYTIGPTARSVFRQLKPEDGISHKQNFLTLSLLQSHSPDEWDRSCIEAGIPDNYCVCQEFIKISESSDEVLGAAYYLVYVHLYSKIADQLDLCHELDLEKVHQAEYYDFTKMKAGLERPTREATNLREVVTPDPGLTGQSTTAIPTNVTHKEQDMLPSREYNIRFSTIPGGALFQEVVRYYGEDIESCRSEARKVSAILADPLQEYSAKHNSVIDMNAICRFSVHSDSISRLNLYKDQSKCVTHNIEVKKICFCRDLLNKTDT